jgi:hypothetical protein
MPCNSNGKNKIVLYNDKEVKNFAFYDYQCIGEAGLFNWIKLELFHQ